jgi:hypothetical protein
LFSAIFSGRRTTVHCRWLWILPLLLLGVAVAWGQEKEPADPMDWLSIPDFSVEAAVGMGVTETGALTGEASRFAAEVGVVFCRVDAIDLSRAQKVSLVWLREDEERSRTALTLDKNRPSGNAQMAIPADQAGSWRVEVQDERGQVLAVAPFVVGKPSVIEGEPLKKAPTKKQP